MQSKCLEEGGGVKFLSTIFLTILPKRQKSKICQNLCEKVSEVWRSEKSEKIENPSHTLKQNYTI